MYAYKTLYWIDHFSGVDKPSNPPSNKYCAYKEDIPSYGIKDISKSSLNFADFGVVIVKFRLYSRYSRSSVKCYHKIKTESSKTLV